MKQGFYIEIKAGWPAFLLGIQFGKDEDNDDRLFIEIGVILISIEISLIR